MGRSDRATHPHHNLTTQPQRRDQGPTSGRSGPRPADSTCPNYENRPNAQRPALPITVGASGFSPRPGRFAEWLRYRLGWDVWLEPVLRPDVGPVLDEIRKVTRVEIKVSADEARRLDASGFFEGEDDPLGALYTAQQAQHGGIIGLEMSVGQGSGADQGFFRSLLERMRGADLSSFRTARAHVHLGDGIGSTVIDFLHDRVVAEIEVDQPSGRQRLLEDHAAQKTMEAAWEQFIEVDEVLDYVDKPDGQKIELPDRLFVE